MLKNNKLFTLILSINYKFCARRDGDLPAFWADASLAYEKLGWKPKYKIDEMCSDTWRWQSGNLNGYNSENM